MRWRLAIAEWRENEERKLCKKKQDVWFVFSSFFFCFCFFKDIKLQNLLLFKFLFYFVLFFRYESEKTLRLEYLHGLRFDSSFSFRRHRRHDKYLPEDQNVLASRLDIHVAVRFIDSRHQTAQSLLRGKNAKINDAVQCNVRTGWDCGSIGPISTGIAYFVGKTTGKYHKLTVERRGGPEYLPRPIPWIQTLPDCPHTINLCMVQIESRIAGARKGI